MLFACLGYLSSVDNDNFTCGTSVVSSTAACRQWNTHHTNMNSRKIGLYIHVAFCCGFVVNSVSFLGMRGNGLDNFSQALSVSAVSFEHCVLTSI